MPRLGAPCEAARPRLPATLGIERLEARQMLVAGPVGPVFPVNAPNPTNQYDAAVASDDSGRFVMVWSSFDQDGSNDAVYARVFAADGTAQTPEFQVNQTTQGAQTTPAVAMQPDGNFVVTWWSSGQIMARQYTPTGTAKGNEFVTLSPNHSPNPAVATDGAGNFVVVAERYTGDPNGVDLYAQRISATGTKIGGEFRVNNATTGDQVQPTIDMDAGGNVAVAWSTGPDVYLRRFSAAGAPLADDAKVNTQALAYQSNPSLAMDDAGDFVVAWDAGALQNNGQDVYARRYAASGAAATDPFVVNTVTTGTQVRPVASMNATGQLVITWVDNYQAFGQLYDAAGTVQGPQFKVYAGPTANYDTAPVSLQKSGNFVIAWEAGDDPNSSARGIFARRFAQFTNPASVGNFVWNDANGNGIQDTTEAGVNGVTVSIYTAAGDLIDTAVTAGGGAYRFDTLRPGQSYYLQFTRPANQVFTPADQGIDSADSDVDPVTGRTAPFTLAADQVDLTRDAGVTAPGAIAGTVFADRDGDGAAGGGETGAVKWTVYADLNGNGQRELIEPVAVTDSAGKFTITGLTPGSYPILADVQTGWTQTTPPAVLAAAPGKTTTPGALIGVWTGVQPKLTGPEGAEFRANTTTAGQQTAPVTAVAPDGSYVVVWSSAGQDGSSWGVYAQRYAAAGAPVGPEFGVNATTAGSQSQPAVTVDDGGNFTVVWTSDQGGTPDVYLRRFDPTGTPLTGEVRVNAYTADSQFLPSVAVDGNRNLIVAWTSNNQNGSGTRVFARRFAPTGAPLGGEIAVSSNAAGNQANPAVAANAAGRFVVAWDTLGSNVQARLFDPTGAPLGDNFTVNDYTGGGQANPSVAMFPDGRFVVAWDAFGQEISGRGIMMKRFKASGMPEAVEQIVNTYINLNQTNAAVAADADGNFAVVWQSETKDGSIGLGLQRFDAAGRRYGVELQPNTTTAGTQWLPAIGMNALGDSVVVWASDAQDGSSEGIYGQRFTRVLNPASVGDFVWTDTDGDGLQDATEAGRDGVTVSLFTEAGLLVDVTTTAQGGRYRFDGVKGGQSYYIQFTLPAGLVLTRQDQGTNDQIDSDASPATLRTAAFALAPGQVDLGRDAGVATLGSISGTLYNDADGSGTRDAGEPVLSGWKVYVDSNLNGQLDSGEPSATSDASGAYSITGLTTGTYQVRVVPLPGWTQTTPAGDLSITLPVGYAYKGVDVGLRFPQVPRVARPWGPQVQVNTSVGSSQIDPAIAFDAAGNYVVVWKSDYADTQGDIFAQRFDAAGNRLGGEFRVHASAPGVQVSPAVAMDAGGNFMVVWQASQVSNGDGAGTTVMGRVFAADGTARGTEFVVNATASGDQLDPAVAADAAGNFIVAWRTNTATNPPADLIQARRFNASGAALGGDFTVSDTAFSAPQSPVIVRRPGGGFAIAYTQGGGKDGSDAGVFVRQYDAAGNPVGAALQANASTAGAQQSPSLGYDAAGNFVVAWEGAAQDGDGWGIFARRFTAVGSPVGGEITVNTFVTGDQRWPAVAVEADGSFIVSWSSAAGGYLNPSTTSGPGNFAQRFDAAGNRVGGEFRTGDSKAAGNTPTVIGVTGTGAFFVGFYGVSSSGFGTQIFLQRFEQFTNPASVGGTVWDDTDGDGVRDVNETGRSGVTVRLYTAGGLLLDTATTTAGGAYRFDLLDPKGSYVLEVVPATGTVVTRKDVGSNDARDSDFAPFTNRTAPIGLTADGVDLTHDAGLVPPASVAGTVFNDADSDAFQSAGERGLSSWLVFLDLDADGTLDAGETSTATTATGAFSFTGLSPGVYRVAAVPQVRWTQTSTSQALTLSLLAGQNLVGADVGEHTDAPAAPLTPVGGASLVNPTSSAAERSTAIGMDSAGNYVLAWESNDGTNSDVYAQLFDAAGVARTAPFLVSENVAGNQVTPTVAVDGAGNFVVTWFSDATGAAGLFGRRFNAAGGAYGPQFVIGASPVPPNASFEAMAMDDAGNFVVAWQVGFSPTTGIHVSARRFGPTGTPLGAEFPVNAGDPAANQTLPQVDMNASGEFVIGWAEDNGAARRFFVQRYAASGTPNGAPLQASAIGQWAWGGTVGINAGGETVVGWWENPNGISTLRARRFDAAGQEQGQPFVVRTGGGDSPRVALDDAGNFTFVYSGPDADGSGLYGRRFNGAGLAVGDEFRVNTITKAQQLGPAIATDNNGHLVVTWVTSYSAGNGGFPSQMDVSAQRFTVVTNPAAVEGVVWNDVNGDGIRQPGEAGRDGVEVDIRNAAGAPVGTTLTANGGRYRFANLLPGTGYVVHVYPATGTVSVRQHQGGDPTVDSDVDPVTGDATPFTAPAAGATAQVDAGLAKPGSVSGVRFNDVNGDGVRQAGEPGLVGFVVYLDGNANGQLDPGEISTATAADGSFTLSNLIPGPYRLAELPQDAWTLTTAPAQRDVIVGAGQSVAGRNLGGHSSAPMSHAVPLGPAAPASTGGMIATASAADAAGNYVLVWQALDSNGWGVFARQFAADGTPKGAAFQVNTQALGDQVSPAVGSDAAGNFVVVWQDVNTQSIVVQRYTAAGQKLGAAITATPSLGYWRAPHVAVDGQGRFVVTWMGNESSTSPFDVFAQRFNASGQLSGGLIRIGATDAVNNYSGGHVTMDAAGNFLLVWNKSYIPGSSYDLGLFAQRFNPLGTPIGSELTLDTVTGGYLPAMAPSGDFVLLRSLNGSLYLQRFNAAGVQQGALIPLATISNPNTSAAVTIDPAGNVIVAYPQYRSGWGVYTRRFNAAGVPVDPETRVDSITGTGTDPGVVDGPTVSAGPNGFVVGWAGPTVSFFRTAQPGDANGDGAVNFDDLLLLSKNYNQSGATWAQGDFDGNGVVDFDDLLALSKRYNTVQLLPTAAPAPTLALAPATTSSVLGDTDTRTKPVFSTKRVVKPTPPPKPAPAKPKASASKSPRH